MDVLDPYTSKPKESYKLLQKAPKNYSTLRNVFLHLADPELKMYPDLKYAYLSVRKENQRDATI